MGLRMLLDHGVSCAGRDTKGDVHRSLDIDQLPADLVPVLGSFDLDLDQVM